MFAFSHCNNAIPCAASWPGAQPALFVLFTQALGCQLRKKSESLVGPGSACMASQSEQMWEMGKGQELPRRGAQWKRLGARVAVQTGAWESRHRLGLETWRETGTWGAGAVLVERCRGRWQRLLGAGSPASLALPFNPATGPIAAFTYGTYVYLHPVP